jgi:CheY-like chemotaxis protein
MMAGGERILVAGAVGWIIEQALAREFPAATVEVADGRTAVELVVAGRVRFDVVLSDLSWNGQSAEFDFDGFDVLDVLRRRPAPVIFAVQGHGMERDYIDESAERPEVAGIYCTATGPGPLFEAVRIAVEGRRLPSDQFPWGDSPPGVRRIHRYFSSGRGITAARMAGAIASGRAVSSDTLARASMVSHFTAARLVDYLGPLILDRGEHDSELKMTPEAVYRWCGMHGRYILSWCRRNRLLDALGR